MNLSSRKRGFFRRLKRGTSKKVSTMCISPKGTRYVSPGQGRVSVARQAAALGFVYKRMFGRARSFAINRHVTEADTKPRFDFVLDCTPSCCDVNRSDDGAFALRTQGCALGCHIFALSGQGVSTRWLFEPQKFLGNRKESGSLCLTFGYCLLTCSPPYPIALRNTPLVGRLVCGSRLLLLS